MYVFSRCPDANLTHCRVSSTQKAQKKGIVAVRPYARKRVPLHRWSNRRGILPQGLLRVNSRGNFWRPPVGLPITLVQDGNPPRRLPCFKQGEFSAARPQSMYKFLVLDPVRLIGVVAKAALTVGFVIGVIALEPNGLAVALEG